MFDKTAAADPRYIYRPVLDLIGQTEGTARKRGYNETLAYGLLTGGDVDLVSLTLDQVDGLQTRMLAHPANRWNSSALGMYQIVRKTCWRIRDKLELTGAELYDAYMQDRMACFLLGDRGIDRWLEGRMDEDDLINELAQEWASLPTTRDIGYYGGQKAAVKSARVREVLAEVRARYETRDQTPEPYEPAPDASLPEIATIEAVTRLAAMTPEQLQSAAMAIAMAQAVQHGWSVADPQSGPATVPALPGRTAATQETDMNGIKSWFKSKGVLGGLTALAALIGPVFGLDLGSTNINDAQVAINELIAAIGALVAIYGRVTAKSQIAGGVTGKG